MTLEEARKINDQIVGCAHARTFGRGEDPGLPDCSLEDMLIASRLVGEAGMTDNGDGTKTIHVRCDPRLVAAMYVLDQYDVDGRGPIVSVAGKGVGVLRVGAA